MVTSSIELGKTINQSVIMFPSEPEPIPGFTVFVTGHMPDKPNRATPRFPENAVEEVRNDLRTTLSQLHHKQPIQQVVCSATAGTDLLAIEWAVDNGVPAEIYLPYEEESFIQGAVNYGNEGQRWLSIFQRAKQAEKVQWHYPVLTSDPNKKAIKTEVEKLSSTGQHYVDLNLHMVSRLKTDDYVVAVWDGKGGDAPGGTEHALRLAKGQQQAKITILKNHLSNITKIYPL